MDNLYKNKANQVVYFRVRNLITGAYPSGLSITATVSKDGGSAAAATNAVTDVTGQSGVYKLTLTQTETNCDSLSVNLTLPSTQYDATSVICNGLLPADLSYINGNVVEVKTKTDQLSITDGIVTATLSAAYGDKIDAINENLPSKADVEDIYSQLHGGLTEEIEGGSWKFKEAAMPPSSGGDATEDKQDEILAKVSDLKLITGARFD